MLSIVAPVALAASPTPGTSARAATAPGVACEDGARPSSITDWVRRGDCLRSAKQFEAAVSAYQSGLASDPKGSHDLYLGMGIAYEELQRFEDELAAMQSASRFDAGDPEVIYHLGGAYEQLGDYPTAMDYFRKVVAVRPNDNRAHRNIGFVLLQQGKPEEALAPLETAIQIDPKDWKAHLNLSAAYTKTYNAISEELKAFATSGAHEVSPRQQELQNKIKTVNYLAKGTEHARDAARLNPDDYRTWYSLGTSLLDEANSLPEAMDAFKRAAELRPNDYALLRNMTLAQQRSGRTADAYETCKKLQSISDNDKWLITTMATLEDKMGRLEDAEKSYRAALAFDDGDWGIRVALARILQRQGRSAEAQEQVSKAKQTRPELAAVIDGYFGRP
jgi:tetratricopeptide (TPR) repeat protein